MPANKKGREKAKWSGFIPIKYPLMPSPIDSPTDLAIFVIPFAAER